MSETEVTSVASPSAPAPRVADTLAGASVLLAALPIGFALWALWLINSTYEQYRGRTDLDMPEWFVINMGLTFKVVALAGVGGLCLLVAGGLFLRWARQAGWLLRAGFVVQWLLSAAMVALIVWSRQP